MELTELGWNNQFNDSFNAVKSENVFPARVATAQREIYSILSETGEYRAEITGKIRFNAASISDLPVVGDWVMARLSPEGNLAVIEAILPRKTKFSRKSPGEITEEQVLVSNIDIVFLVNGLDTDFNLRRIERYLILAVNSGIKPVILLNKTDLCDNLQERVEEVKSIATGHPIHTLSAANNMGIEFLDEYITKGVTVSFIGSSGVGKSTIINRLLGEERLKVGTVRESDGKGKHITTHRELILLPGGGIVIDNPGLRELRLWAEEDSLDTTFNDIKDIAANCRFKDCKHADEPGCAVRAAMENGALDPKRFNNYTKVKKELRYLATRKEKIKSRNAKVVWEKNISKLTKQMQ